ncbi:MAG: hypothetical protein K9I95_07330 [Flavobacteriaceae bacterium]|nr:hypothetical protein [Flavobacteriaceae bacterium]
MSTNKRTLFSEFEPVSMEQWVEQVNKDLKGADFEKKLVWNNLSKIDIQPFYNAQHNLEFVTNTGENSTNLINYRNIVVTSAEMGNNQAHKAISEGINGLLFTIETPILVDKLLNNINLSSVSISFILKTNDSSFARDFFDYAEQNIKDPKNLNGYFDLQLITQYVTKGSIEPTQLNTLCNIVKLGKLYPNFKTITVSGTTYLDAGSNQVQEVAYTLNALVYVIEQCLEREIHIETIFNNIHIQLAIGSEYFIEISKFRAFNSLIHALAAHYGVTVKHILTGKTAIWSKSITDAHTNLLRATTETMSAILGNVDGVLIDAYDSEFNNQSEFSSRIAGNIATILKEESYFGNVSNPVDGSYYIEEVSTKIAEKALVLFKAIEVEGGFYKAFESGLIQQQIALIRQEKIKQISQRRLPMVGVNKYPNLMESVASEILSSGETKNPEVLTPRRACLEIESIRKVTEQIVEKTKNRPIVELTSFGNLTMRKARAAFSYDFIGVSGFKILAEQSYADVEKAAESSAKSASNVVVICSSDEDYDAHALRFVQVFRAINKDKVLLLAGNPVNLLETLTALGLDGCIHIKSDVVETISGIQKKVQKNIKSLQV